MGKIYRKCTVCGKKKSPSQWAFCSAECRRKRKTLIDKFWETKPNVEAKIAELLNKKPMVHSDLNAELLKEFKDFKVNKWDIGRMMSALVSEGKLRIYPYRISGRGRCFCYIKSAQKEEAVRLYCEYVHSLPTGIRVKAYVDSLEIRKLAPKILKLWSDGYSVEEISKETGISITRIKELIVRRRE